MKIYYFTGYDVSFHCFANSLEEAVNLSIPMSQWFIDILEVVEIPIPETPQLIENCKTVTAEFRILSSSLIQGGNRV